MPRPTEVSVSAYLMAVFNLLSLFTVHWRVIPFAKPLLAAFLLVVAIGYVVLFFFWKGENWARWIVLVIAVLVMFGNMREIAHPARPDWDTVIRVPLYYTQALFASFLLYYLNTQGARSWFYRDRLRRMQLRHNGDGA